jgi:hypothetical protein
MPAKTTIQIRRDTAANWVSSVPVLAAGEFGLETDTNKLKVGNGTDTWVDLPYFGGQSENPEFTIESEFTFAAPTAVGANSYVPGATVILVSDVSENPGFSDGMVFSMTGTLAGGYSIDGIELVVVSTEIGPGGPPTFGDRLNITVDVVDSEDIPAFEAWANEGPYRFGMSFIASNPTVKNVSAEEIGYLDGVTSNIQAQLDSKSSQDDLDEKADKSNPEFSIGFSTFNAPSVVSVGNGYEAGATVISITDVSVNPGLYEGMAFSMTGTLAGAYSIDGIELEILSAEIAAGGPPTFAQNLNLTVDVVDSADLDAFSAWATEYPYIFSGVSFISSGDSISVSSTEIGYLDGVTSNIQAQLDSKPSQDDLDSKAPINYSTVTMSTDTTMDSSHNGKLVRSTSASNRVFACSTDFPVGGRVDFVQGAAGTIEFVALTGTVLRSSLNPSGTPGVSAKTNGTYTFASLVCVFDNGSQKEFFLTGDIKA